MDTIEVTPAHRFAAIKLERSLPLGNLLRRAICMARDVDGFPHSYSTEQVRAATSLLTSLDDQPKVVWANVNVMLAAGDTPITRAG
jgi:hypothetical protein